MYGDPSETLLPLPTVERLSAGRYCVTGERWGANWAPLTVSLIDPRNRVVSVNASIGLGCADGWGNVVNAVDMDGNPADASFMITIL